MKRIIKVMAALLLPFMCSAQITATLYFSNQTAVDNTVVSVSSASYTAGTMYVFTLLTTVDALNETPDTDPVVNTGSANLVLTKRYSLVDATHNWGVLVYSGIPTSNTTTSITWTYAETQTNNFVGIYSAASAAKFDIVNIQGNSTTSADPAFTLGGYTSSTILGIFMNKRNPFTGTAEASWTEDLDTGFAGPWGWYMVHRNNTSDNTLTVTSSSVAWIGVGIQLINPRKAVVVD